MKDDARGFGTDLFPWGFRSRAANTFYLKRHKDLTFHDFAFSQFSMISMYDKLSGE